MATEVSTVASKSLSDDELMANASVLSKEVVYNLLHDETLKEQASNFVTGTDKYFVLFCKVKMTRSAAFVFFSYYSKQQN